MRGRYPDEFVLKAEHIEIFQMLVRDGRVEQRIARGARILLMRAEGERVETIAERTEQTPSTVFRLCQRYRQRGAKAIYDAARPGRPRVFPPSGSRPHRKSGL